MSYQLSVSIHESLKKTSILYNSGTTYPISLLSKIEDSLRADKLRAGDRLIIEFKGRSGRFYAIYLKDGVFEVNMPELNESGDHKKSWFKFSDFVISKIIKL